MSKVLRKLLLSIYSLKLGVSCYQKSHAYSFVVQIVVSVVLLLCSENRKVAAAGCHYRLYLLMRVGGGQGDQHCDMNDIPS